MRPLLLPQMRLNAALLLLLLPELLRCDGRAAGAGGVLASLVICIRHVPYARADLGRLVGLAEEEACSPRLRFWQGEVG